MSENIKLIHRAYSTSVDALSCGLKDGDVYVAYLTSRSSIVDCVALYNLSTDVGQMLQMRRHCGTQKQKFVGLSFDGAGEGRVFVQHLGSGHSGVLNGGVMHSIDLATGAWDQEWSPEEVPHDHCRTLLSEDKRLMVHTGYSRLPIEGTRYFSSQTRLHVYDVAGDSLTLRGRKVITASDVNSDGNATLSCGVIATCGEEGSVHITATDVDFAMEVRVECAELPSGVRHPVVLENRGDGLTMAIAGSFNASDGSASGPLIVDINAADETYTVRGYLGLKGEVRGCLAYEGGRYLLCWGDEGAVLYDTSSGASDVGSWPELWRMPERHGKCAVACLTPDRQHVLCSGWRADVFGHELRAYPVSL